MQRLAVPWLGRLLPGRTWHTFVSGHAHAPFTLFSANSQPSQCFVSRHAAERIQANQGASNETLCLCRARPWWV
jgi:hypothetical protein